MDMDMDSIRKAERRFGLMFRPRSVASGAHSVGEVRLRTFLVRLWLTSRSIFLREKSLEQSKSILFFENFRCDRDLTSVVYHVCAILRMLHSFVEAESDHPELMI